MNNDWNCYTPCEDALEQTCLMLLKLRVTRGRSDTSTPASLTEFHCQLALQRDTDSAENYGGGYNKNWQFRAEAEAVHNIISY